ncbi:hypothetical protein SCLCIDRAFT_8157 [Scleroderma citrinum Foug A]|uniref:Uncharacterized protein n=1 Tax=Scleroderma citrinum Foug A TaxID=1036808 RepID=A0A0C3ECQ6_9AGAM|nr:hypothetical protein SCLCIDRAFT_8157 [Scleroderma citrinum Foug A]
MRRRPLRFSKCGALIDLERIHELFQGSEDAHGHVQNEAPFWVYPLAYSRKMGNVKSSSVMSNFHLRLNQIDLDIRPPVDEDAVYTDDEDDDMQIIRGAPVLRPLGSQIYNSLSHCVHNEAKFHAVQLGLVMSAFAGSSAATASGRHHWQRRLRFCDGGLPHVRFNQKISGPGQPQALRFENTYTLDVFRMKPQHQNGSMIYEHIMCPLLKSWSHPSVLEPIQDAMVIFCPDIIPDLFKYASYPITALINLFWKKFNGRLRAGSVIDPCTVEFVSMLECTLNYAHTGNTAVLCKKLMDCSWFSLGLLEDGFPALSDAFIALGALSMEQLVVCGDNWPVESRTCRPLTSSRRSQQLMYGKAHYKAYEACFTIRLAIDNIPQDRYSSIQDMPFRLSCYAAEIALKVYFNDVKDLVNSTIQLLLKPVLSGDDRLAKRTAIVDHTPATFELTSSYLGRQPVTFFADLILKQCDGPQATRKPPFIKGGDFLPVARVAVHEICSFASHARPPSVHTNKFVLDAITTACEALKINHVPWSCGPRSTTIIHDVWLNLGAKAQPPSTLFRQHSNSSIAIQTSQAMQASDPRADWSALNVQLISFHTVLHKVNLPVEWNVSHIHGNGVPEYIVKAYQDVQSSYNANNPLHHLALIASIICAGLIPDIFPSSDKETPHMPSLFADHLHSLDWVSRNRKGASEAGPFITMVSSFIINMYDVDSRISLRTKSQLDLKAWFNKHTAKGITLLLLCRLGLATAATRSAFRSAKWKTDVMPLSESLISQKYAEVVRLLRSGGRYGSFDAVCFLAGFPAVIILAKKNYVSPRALPSHLNSRLSSQPPLTSTHPSIVSVNEQDDDSTISPISLLNSSKGLVHFK